MLFSKKKKAKQVIEMYDHLTPEEAIVAAWTNEGSHPAYHQSIIRSIDGSAPLLARAIRRLVREQ